MTTTASYVSDFLAGRNVRHITADLACVNVESISSLTGSNKYGVNGTFFFGSNLTGIAVAKSGSSASPVHPGGRYNGVPSDGKIYYRGTMIHYDPPVSSLFLETDVIHDINTKSLSNIKWAIGGLSLHLNYAFVDEDAFLTRVTPTPKGICTLNQENAGSVNNVCDKSRRNRTAIGFAPGRKIILAAIEAASIWEVRNVMIELNCTRAISLDGGGSTGIRGKKYGVDFTWGATSTTVLSAVTVNPDSWV